MLYTVESISLSGLLRHWFFSLREVKRLGFTQPVDASAELKYLPHTLTLGHPLLQSDMPIPFPLISDSLHLTLPGFYTFSCSDIQREGNMLITSTDAPRCSREKVPWSLTVMIYENIFEKDWITKPAIPEPGNSPKWQVTLSLCDRYSQCLIGEE